MIERNEALQMEINRLRFAKTETSPPPMEMLLKTGELLMSTALLPPTEMHRTNHSDKFTIKKNCYTTNNRRLNDIPRTAVSLFIYGVANVTLHVTFVHELMLHFRFLFIMVVSSNESKFVFHYSCYMYVDLN